MSPVRITAADILPPERWAAERPARRRAILAHKRPRRILVGPFAAFHFESYETIFYQIQEMLHIEQGGAEQLGDELRAYAPLIPQGGELVATLMFEIDDPRRRDHILHQLGGVEESAFIALDGEKIMARPEQEIERTSQAGKTSAVHFLHFPFRPEQKKRFRSAQKVEVGFTHPGYAHSAALGAQSRAALAADFSSAAP